MQDLMKHFKAATWPKRIAMAIVGIALIAGGMYAIKVWIMPFCIIAFCFLVRMAISYAFVVLVVSIFCPSLGKKMVELGCSAVERLLIDPLLMLFRGSGKNKKNSN